MIEDLDKKMQLLVVHEPHQFLSFGWFLPIKKMPRLCVFKKETLD